MNTYLFTQKGFFIFQKRYDKLIDELALLRSKIEYEFEHGGDGWHDNFGFEQLQIQIQKTLKEINDVRAILEKAEIVHPSKNPITIQIGCRVVFECKNKKIEVSIVGYGESVPENNMLSYDTPAAQVLIGARVGEERHFFFDGKEKKVKIVEIRPIE